MVDKKRLDVSSGANPNAFFEDGQWACQSQVRMFGSDVDIWVKCFIAMTKHQGAGPPKYKGTELDSNLSAPMLERVQEACTDFIKDRK